MREVTITRALRSPIGTAGRGLASLDAARLAAPVLAAVVSDRDDPPADVLLGNCRGPGGDVARVAVLSAGLPDTVPAVTIDRQCASGLAAIELGARMVGHGGPVLAGGVESASSAVPGRARFAPADRDLDMGPAADLLAEAHRVSRARQDEYAARSHQRAYEAWSQGAFDSELVPFAELSRDERVRDGMTAERLSRLPPAFRDQGSVTAGNSCGVNDGAAVVELTPGGGRGLRLLATATVGVAPEAPGLGIVPAVRRVLAAGGVGPDDVDVWEFNEAFAGQILACCDELDLPDERVCRQGGALALGHPWAASGAVLAVRLFAQMIAQEHGRLGVAAIAGGGGQGTAVLVESCL